MNKIERCVSKNMYTFWLLNEYCKDLFVLGLELVLNRINPEVLSGSFKLAIYATDSIFTQ